MPESRDTSPGEDYFNDLSQQPSNNGRRNGEATGAQEDHPGQAPKVKRIACVLCRKRKLKCDGARPSCGTCTRLQHECSYDEVRRKSGPKRGYVKALEARLAQVETLLNRQDDTANGGGNAQTQARQSNGSHDVQPELASAGVVNGTFNGVSSQPPGGASSHAQEYVNIPAAFASGENIGPVDEQFPWEMIGLGLDEPLPTQDVVNELNQVYFEKVHPSLPVIHQPRYYAAMNLAPHMRPPICLRYAMWSCAASVTDKYQALTEHFYHRARKYIQQDEMKGHGEAMITIAHVQTWLLIATHEFKLMYFPRAWASAGRASRLATMMGLHRLDGQGLDVKQCLPPPRDWTEREERRRTFWMCFCVDRYSSIGTGWPMMIEEVDILTNLPGDEESYATNKAQKTVTLAEALEPGGCITLSPFASIVLLACLFGRNLVHLHRPNPDDRDDDLNGEFWRRHRYIDNVLLNIMLALPDHLRLPAGLNNPNVVFSNMKIHTSTICLHQAAIFKADKNKMPARIAAESKVRCITAAAEIASIMRQVSHLDLSAMNPFISFCLYVAARVFVQYLKSRPRDTQVRASLQFLLTAMAAIKRKNPLTESFLVQLDVDLETAGIPDTNSLRAYMRQSNMSAAALQAGCTGCPTDHIVIGSMTPDRGTYGDGGLAAYTRPEQNTISMSNGDGNSAYGVGSNSYQYDLPNRQRTPGSAQGSGGSRLSPQSLNPGDMDMTSDNTKADNYTPASSGNKTSSHSSYSPPDWQQQRQQQKQDQTQPILPTATMFDPVEQPFATDFEMHEAAPSQADSQPPGFVLPTDWNADTSTSSGFTPGASAHVSGIMAAFSGNGLGDLTTGMTDAEWSQVLESFDGWDSGLEHNHNLQEGLYSARR